MFNQNNSNDAPKPIRTDAHAHAHAHTHLGALCNHLEEASTCFIAPPGGFYSNNLRNYNLSSEGEHKLPPPCSVSNSSDAYQWEVHFLPDDFLEVIAGLFADGRLNATRQLASEPAEPKSGSTTVYLAGDFTVQMHSREPSSKGDQYYYELSYTPATMSSIRMFALVEQEELGNMRAELESCGVQLPEEVK